MYGGRVDAVLEAIADSENRKTPLLGIDAHSAEETGIGFARLTPTCCRKPTGSGLEGRCTVGRRSGSQTI